MFKASIFITTAILASVTSLSFASEEKEDLAEFKTQILDLVENYEFTEKELAYKKAFMDDDSIAFNRLVSRFYDPKSEGVLSDFMSVKEKLIECNVLSYKAFDPELSNVAFETAFNGGTYEQAKEAFSVATKAYEDGDAVAYMIHSAGTIIKVCTDHYGINLIPDAQ